MTRRIGDDGADRAIRRDTMMVPRAAKTRVLLIDDDEKLNALLAEYLGRFGFSVRAVVHPDEGLHALKVEPPDIVILDVMLPDMDGFAVCRKVRESSRVPIIMLTARGDVVDRIVGLESSSERVDRPCDAGACASGGGHGSKL
jgi:DNA-binding response OmpR family regulator